MTLLFILPEWEKAMTDEDGEENSVRKSGRDEAGNM